MIKRQIVIFILLFLFSLSAQPIGLSITANGCGNIVLSSSEISSAGGYFETYKDCSASIDIAGIDQTTTWTLKAKISALSAGLPVKIAINGDGFQYLNSANEITLITLGTGTTPSGGLPITVRIDRIDADDGYGNIIDNVNILYRVISN